MEVTSEGDRGDCNGSRKPRDDRDECGHEPGSRMVNLREIGVFTSGTRDGRRKLGVAKSTAQRNQSAKQPENQNGKTARKIL